MAFTIVCPVFTADESVRGHGTATGYTVGGALSHATRCASMGDIMRERGVAVETRATSTRGIATEDEFFQAAARKLAQVTSAPEPAAQAAETVIIEGVAYRKA
jgi:hypothetical protein